MPAIWDGLHTGDVTMWRTLLELTVCAGAVSWIIWQVLARREFRSVLERHRADLLLAQDRLAEQSLQLDAAEAALKASEAALAERSGVLDTTLQHIDQGVLMIDAAGVVVVHNQQVVEMLDLPAELLAARPNFDEVLEFQWRTQEFSRTAKSLQDFVRSGGIVATPRLYERERPNGMSIEVRSQPLAGGGVVRTFTDITERKRTEALVERAAMVDELTGLPTRLALERRLQACLSSMVDHEPVNLFYLNLDRFRLLNDARGHEIGDQILIAVARRIGELCGPDDMVSRVGGDEFGILRVQAAEQAEEFSSRLLAALSDSYSINGGDVSITASIGVVRVEPGVTPATLIRNADIALNRAKDGGRDQVCYYTPSMTAAREQRFQLEQSLREAVRSNLFRLAYQPIIAVESGAIVGYEALLRWNDRIRGEVSPSDFIPIAEATGLIVSLGRSALEWACFEAASWPTQRTVAVNLSPAQFQSDNIVEIVRDVLARSGLRPERLELEITEGMLLENTGPVLQTMEELQRTGVALTLDDFGAGHAGLSYLKRFPFKKMKIDGSFVRSLGCDRESDAIVEAILLLGKRLNMRVVAEGVETEAQLEQLRRMDCPYVQGYLTGRPMPPEQARVLQLD